MERLLVRFHRLLNLRHPYCRRSPFAPHIVSIFLKLRWYLHTMARNSVFKHYWLQFLNHIRGHKTCISLRLLLNWNWQYRNRLARYLLGVFDNLFSLRTLSNFWASGKSILWALRWKYYAGGILVLAPSQHYSLFYFHTWLVFFSDSCLDSFLPNMLPFNRWRWLDAQSLIV